MIFMHLFTFFGIMAISVSSILAMPFMTLFGFITGDYYRDVVLPYNAEEGLVWEYDAVDDPYIRLEKMSVDGDEQVFRFVSSNTEADDIDSENGRCMELIFTSENGQTETYYAYIMPIALYEQVFLVHEDETVTYEITAERDSADSEFEWKLDTLHSDSDNIVYFSDKTGVSNKFTLVYFKDRPHHDGILEASLFYRTNDDRVNVWHSAEVDFSSGEPVVIWESGDSDTINQEV